MENSTIGITIGILIFIVAISGFLVSLGSDETIFPSDNINYSASTTLEETDSFSGLGNSFENIRGEIEDIPYGIGTMIVIFIVSVIGIVAVFWARGV